jgi:hypothetical protein
VELICDLQNGSEDRQNARELKKRSQLNHLCMQRIQLQQPQSLMKSKSWSNRKTVLDLAKNRLQSFYVSLTAAQHGSVIRRSISRPGGTAGWLWNLRSEWTTWRPACRAAPGPKPSDPPLPGTTVRKGLASWAHAVTTWSHCNPEGKI